MTGRPFTFDTVFELDGGVYQPPRPKRAYTPDEVEQIRAAAYAEGEASTLAQAEAASAAALEEVARLVRGALATLSEVAHSHRSASAELALAAARKIADAALERFPDAPAAAAVETLAREIEASPRLLVHASPGDLDRLRGSLDQAAAKAGFSGAIVLQPDPERPRAAFLFDWGEGRAAFDPDQAAARVTAALETALAVEGVHAEVVPTSPDQFEDMP